MKHAFWIGSLLFLLALLPFSYSFEVEQIVSNINDGYTSLAVDSSDVVHVVTANNSDLVHCNGTFGSWTCEVVDTVSQNTRYTGIAVDVSDNLHISYSDGNATNGDLRYCNGTFGSWTCEVVENAGNLGFDSSISIGSNGVVRIGHHNTGGNELRYCNGTFGSWTCQFVAGEGSSPSIATDSADVNGLFSFDGTSAQLCTGNYLDWSCGFLPNSYSDLSSASILVDSSSNYHMGYFANSSLRYCNGTSDCEFVALGGSGADDDLGLDVSISESVADIHLVSFNESGDSSNSKLFYCSGGFGGWTCSNLYTVNRNLLGSVTDRWSAVKRGFLPNATGLYSRYLHVAWKNNTDLVYGRESVNLVPSVSSSDTTTNHSLVSGDVLQTISSSDSNGDSLTFAIQSDPTSVLAINQSGVLNLTRNLNISDIGTFSVTVNVSDGLDRNETTFLWVINNSAPTISGSDATVNYTTTNNSLVVGFTESDVDGDVLFCVLASNFSKLALNNTCDVISNSSFSSDDIASYYVNVTVNDTVNWSISSVTLTVVDDVDPVVENSSGTLLSHDTNTLVLLTVQAGDDFDVSVFVNVTTPGNSTSQFAMSSWSDQYNFTYSNTSSTGNYSVVFHANDSNGNLGTLSEWFSVVQSGTGGGGGGGGGGDGEEEEVVAVNGSFEVSPGIIDTYLFFFSGGDVKNISLLGNRKISSCESSIPCTVESDRVVLLFSGNVSAGLVKSSEDSFYRLVDDEVVVTAENGLVVRVPVRARLFNLSITSESGELLVAKTFILALVISVVVFGAYWVARPRRFAI